MQKSKKIIKKTTILKVLIALALILLVSTLIVLPILYFNTTNNPNSITINLDEAKVDNYGIKADPEIRINIESDTASIKNQYTLIPGHLYHKDPQIHVKSGSVPCFVYMIIEDQLSSIEDNDTVANQIMRTNQWQRLETIQNTESTTIVYVYTNQAQDTTEIASIVDATTQDKTIPTFSYFKLLPNLTGEQLAEMKDKQIIIRSIAIQADGFKDALEAWNAIER